MENSLQQTETTSENFGGYQGRGKPPVDWQKLKEGLIDRQRESEERNPESNKYIDEFEEEFKSISTPLQQNPELAQQEMVRVVTETSRKARELTQHLEKNYSFYLHLSRKEKEPKPFSLGWARKNKKIKKVFHRNPHLEPLLNEMKYRHLNWDDEITKRMAVKYSVSMNIKVWEKGRQVEKVVQMDPIILVIDKKFRTELTEKWEISMNMLQRLIQKCHTGGPMEKLERFGPDQDWAYRIGYWGFGYGKEGLIENIPRYDLKDCKKIKEWLMGFGWKNGGKIGI